LRQSLYDDDALTDGFAEAGVDVGKARACAEALGSGS
jgi:hypothetical protein